MPVALNVTVMLVGYLLLMGYLALGLRIRRRHPAQSEQATQPKARRARRVVPAAARRGWPGLIRHVVGTAVGGYLLLAAVVVGYYHAVAGLGSRFLVSAFTGTATLVGIALPVFFIASWLHEWRLRRRRSRADWKRAG